MNDSRMRFDVQWNRAHVAVLLLMTISFGGVLAHRALDRNRPAGEKIPINAARVEASRQTIDPNSASVGSLRRLRGIGPAKAQAIVDYRTAGGVFRSVEDLQKVHGIGPALSGENAEYLRFDAPDKPSHTESR